MRKWRSVHRAILLTLVVWRVMGQWPVMAAPIPGFGVIRDLPPGTSLSRAIIPNLTGKPENRFLFKADHIQLVSKNLAQADLIEITLRPGEASETRLILKSACFDFEIGKATSSSPVILSSEGVRLECSGLELLFDESPMILKGPCTLRASPRPARPLSKTGGQMRHRMPEQWEISPFRPSPVHLLATWIASQPAQYIPMRQMLEGSSPSDTLLICSDGMEVSRDVSLVRMHGSGIILSDGVGIASRGGFNVKTTKTGEGRTSMGPMPAWIESLDGSAGVRGLAWNDQDRRVYVCESLDVKYSHSSNSVRFMGGPPIIRTVDGEIRATEDNQYFRIRENGKMMLGPGQWLHRQELVPDRW